MKNECYCDLISPIQKCSVCRQSIHASSKENVENLQKRNNNMWITLTERYVLDKETITENPILINLDNVDCIKGRIIYMKSGKIYFVKEELTINFGELVIGD